MCSVLAGLTAITGVLQYQAQQDQAAAQAARYRAEAENYQNQALAAQQNAQIEGKKQEVIADNYARQEKELRDRRRIIAGQQRAQAGAAGIGQGGSLLDIQSAGDEAYVQDKLTLLSNQRYENYDSRSNQMNYMNQRDSYNVSARNALKDADYAEDIGKAQGLMTILGTATSIIGGLGGSGGGASSSSGNVATSTSSNVGTNTTANWNLGSGYNMTRINSLGDWNKGFNLGNFSKKNYFGYTGR